MKDPNEIARRIREAKQRRQEEQRRRQQLQQEYARELAEQASETEKGLHGARQYLASIFIFLFFASLPLFDQIVDWRLVALCAGVNAICALLASDPSAWMHLCVVILLNLCLLVWSDLILALPHLLRTASPYLLVSYAGVNLLAAATLYLTYVERLCWWSSPSSQAITSPVRRWWARLRAPSPRGRKGTGRAGRGGGLKGADDAKLLQYAADRDWAGRIDNALTILLLGNMALLLYLGVIPLQVLTNSVKGFARILSAQATTEMARRHRGGRREGHANPDQQHALATCVASQDAHPATTAPLLPAQTDDPSRQEEKGTPVSDAAERGEETVGMSSDSASRPHGEEHVCTPQDEVEAINAYALKNCLLASEVAYSMPEGDDKNEGTPIGKDANGHTPTAGGRDGTQRDKSWVSSGKESEDYVVYTGSAHQPHLVTPAIASLHASMDAQRGREAGCLESSCAYCSVM